MGSKSGVDISSVLTDEELETLGEPVTLDDARATSSPLNQEFREYDDPELKTLTGPAFNMAKDLIGEIDPNKDLADQIERTLEAFKDEFSRDTDYPVFVSDSIFDVLDGEESIPVHMRFQGDQTLYPASLRGQEDLEWLIEESDYSFGEAYVQNIEDSFMRNNYVVPVLMIPGQGLVKKTPATVIRQPGMEIVASHDDPGIQKHLGEFKQEEYGGGPGPRIERYKEGDAEFLLLDAGPDAELGYEFDGDELVVRSDGDEIYRNEHARDVVREELNNAFYQLKLE